MNQNTTIITTNAAKVKPSTPAAPSTISPADYISYAAGGRPVVRRGYYDLDTAWAIADMLMPDDYTHDAESSARAGYDVYRSIANPLDYISDCGCRLEVCLAAGYNVNIWITQQDDTPAPSTAPDGNNPSRFARLLRDLETAVIASRTPDDYADQLTAMATAIAYSVIGKCIDPTRKSAQDAPTVSNSGLNPAMIALRRDIAADTAAAANLRNNMDAATDWTYTADGDIRVDVVDAAANDGANALLGETWGDGMDLVHAAAAELMAQIDAGRVAAIGDLERPYTVHRLKRRVYIRLDDSAAYVDEETTPIQEVYRAVRRAISGSRAVQTDPRNGYTYIADMVRDADGLDDIVYRRTRKYADLGGYAVPAGSIVPGAPAMYPAATHHYTADMETVRDYDTMLQALNLSPRQAQVLRLREQGHGCKAIATYLGVHVDSVRTLLGRIQDKAMSLADGHGDALDAWRRDNEIAHVLDCLYAWRDDERAAYADGDDDMAMLIGDDILTLCDLYDVRIDWAHYSDPKYGRKSAIFRAC